MVYATFLTTIFLALAVAANPVVVRKPLVSLSISKRVNHTSIRDLVQHDQTRAKALRAMGEAKAAGILHTDAVINSPTDNQAVSYIASVGIGSPPTLYDLIVDTASGITWIGGSKPYVRTGTSVSTSNTASIFTGSGTLLGNEFIDEVTVGPGLVVPRQVIFVLGTSGGFAGVDGVLGLGPDDLTIGVLSPPNSTPIPTITDNLFAEGVISADEVAISFEPITGTTGEEMNGEITWGGTDSSKFTGAITFAPITSTSPSSEFWGINQSILYGTTTILSSTAGIFDTSTTLILIATNAFNSYKTATGGVIDSATGLLRVTSAQFANLQNLSFVVNSVSFKLTPNGQIWPRSLNTLLGGASGSIFLIVADIGSNSGSGLDFINGQLFLERFYSVYDTTNKRVGLAVTPFTTATTN